MKKLFLVLGFVLLSALSIKAQDNNKANLLPSVLPAPANYSQNINPGNNNITAYNSRFFGNTVGTTSQTFKSFLNTPGTLTNLGGALATNLFGGAINAATGVYYGAEYIAAGSANLVRIDTSTGARTAIGPMSGLSSGHTITGLSWDKTTSTMYALSTNGTTGTLYTCNLTTGALTSVGSTTGSALPIDLAINNAGIIYSVDIGNPDRLTTLNKTTGAATTVANLSLDLNFAQGMAFDGSTDSLFLAAYLAAGTSGIYRADLVTGNCTLVGSFPAASEVDAFVIPGGVARELNPFSLLSPAAGARVVTVAGSSTPVTITWDTSAGGATYKWIFGNPVVPPRRLTIPSNTNSITTTLGALDAILAANGFTNNGSASDSAVGQWNVYAYKGGGAPGLDSLISANGPRAITLRRQQVTLNPFTLVSPPTGTRIVTSPVDLSPVNVTWNRSGLGATYKWLFKVGATYTDPATLRLSSNNSGLDTVLTVRNSQIDSILAGLGVVPGDSVTGQWRVRAFASTDSLNSTAPDRTITFRRAGLLPLNQDFSSADFPPPFWGLDNGGGTTQYWTRNTVSAWGIGTGSAKYDFWSAGTTTPLQTVTSNQFPAVTAPSNYLRFNYTHAFYLSGGTLANDSCIIETSIDGGTTWTRLIGMGASQTISSGTNSSPIMTTVGGPVTGAFTPTSTQWATKVFAMPIGTNKVRFVAKSAFGNNLYIDDVTSGLITGINNSPITLSPERYELSQNYPNPFNPSTKINFSIPKQSFVSLKIYDMLGKEVSQLVSEIKTAGVYSIDFNALNLSSGTYFYQLKAGDFSDIKRMMLIK
ncbi:MAG: T9SS type A sorting domain-containing protein [Ignavibacteria bacterium]|nr:T9SS type A sorting domain-containing protein [Ignavibacteria bacterium]